MSDESINGWVKVWHPVGVQITAPLPISKEVAFSYFESVQNLIDVGFTAQIAGLETDEKVEEIDAFVVGKKKNGDPTIFLYSPTTSLQYPMAVVWEEQFPDLPFDTHVKSVYPGWRPERDVAAGNGFLNTVETFKIVMKSESGSDGKETWKYSRVFGMTEKPVDGTWTDQQLEAVIKLTSLRTKLEAARLLNDSCLQKSVEVAEINGWAKHFSENFATSEDSEVAIEAADAAYTTWKQAQK